MKVNILKLVKEAVIPQYSTEGAAGMDLVATSREIVVSEDGSLRYIEYGTGIALEIPKGFAGLVFPRSSISKTGYSLANSIGLIDSDYRGEIKIRLYPTSTGLGPYEVGDRVAQIVIMPYPDVHFEEVKELTTTERAEGGFGSTGK